MFHALAHADADRAGDDRTEVLIDRADVGRDRHTVVVQDDDDVAARIAGVVQSLVGQAAGHRAVADDGDDRECQSVQVASRRHPVRRRQRRARVTGAELIVLALAPPEESRQSALLPQRGEAVIAAGENLPRIALVADVPDDLVMRRIECGAQRHCQLDHAEPRADVATGMRDHVDQALAHLVRERLIDVVSHTGGHIGAGLGVVELTVALCAAFDSPHDKIVWDVGHQGYPWKILTGRNDRLPTLRQQGGLSGFLRRSESEHDQFGAGHAGTALSAAYGMAAARDLNGLEFAVVAVVGDGAMTCGLPYEALNNAGDSGRDIIVVLNDNGMSIAPNVGAINKYLGSIIASPIGVRMRERVKHVIERASHLVGGKKLVDFAKNVEESIKNLWSPGMLFEELGFRYFGPIDGHNIGQMLHTFDIVKTLKGPRVVHVITEKGKGFPLPEPDLEKYHARAPYDPITGKLKPVNPGPPLWTKVFGDGL